MQRQQQHFGVRALSGRRWLAVMVALAWLAVLPAAAPANDFSGVVVDEGAVIESGNVRLGVHEEGHLNVSCPDGSGLTNCPVGLQFIPTNNEATAPGCLCEGWGVGAPGLDTSGYANEAVDGVVNLEVLDFFANTAEAVSTVLIREGGGGADGGGPPTVTNANGNDPAAATEPVLADGDPLMEVTHDYHPSASQNLYEATVSITNVSTDVIEDVRYRRVMDWDIEPTAFSEFVTIDGDADDLLFSNDDGFQSANPLATRTGGTIGPGTGSPFFDDGPDDHGAMFDFGFGDLGPNETRSFNIYYGAAATENEALLSVDFVGATLYSFGQPNTPTGPTNGDPNTFIFAFGSVGGDALERLSVRKRADDRITEPGGSNGYTVFLVNPNDDPVTVTDVIDTLPIGFTYTGGSSQFNGGAIPDPSIAVVGGQQQLTWPGPFTIPAKSQGLLSFDITVANDQPPGEYFNSATASAVNDAGDPIDVRASGDAAAVRVPEPTVATDPDVAVGPTGSTTVDPATGLFTVAMRRGARSDVTVTVDVECPDGTAPSAVTLVHGSNNYAMTEVPGSGLYTATIPAADVVDGPISVIAICDGTPITNVIGGIVLFDPSGIVTDADTGDPVVGATVTLYKVPFAEADTLTETKDCRTVDTRSGTWDDEPDASPGDGDEVDESIDPPEIDPQVNPQMTTGEGRYGWDVAAGCYYIVVSHPDYFTQFSAIVGVPPEVTDLDIMLVPVGGPPPPPPPPPGDECQGRVVTIFGTPGDDMITGTPGNDVIAGGAGDDYIDGLAGNDFICGNDGDDRLRGGGGNDRLAGNAGEDTLFGSAGNDFLIAGEDADRLYGGAGDDRLVGDRGDDFMVGNSGNDRLFGKGGKDNMRGGRGDDFLRGDAGGDLLFGGADNDYLAGRGGNDRLDGGPDNGGEADRCYGNGGRRDRAVNCETVGSVP